jgi:hypothetical protein
MEDQMIVVMRIDATEENGNAIFSRLAELGLRGQKVVACNAR